MEDKVLWIALKLFLVWLFVMAFCLCICNCLFIRSDKRKTKEAKILSSSPNARTTLLDTSRVGGGKQCCDCQEDEEKGNMNKNSPFIHLQYQQPHQLHQLSPELMTDIHSFQHTGQLSPGLLAHSAYIQRANPKFTIQRPSVDDVNRSQTTHDPIFVDIGPEGTRSWRTKRKKKSPKMTSDVLLNLLRTPSGKYLLFGKDARFCRIETSSYPDLNVLEKFPAHRVPLKTKQKRQLPAPEASHLCDDGDDADDSSSSSSMELPQSPALIITTEADDASSERPRSSSFSGRNSFRSATPYRIRLTPSPSPSSFTGESTQHSPSLPLPFPNHVTVDIPTTIAMTTIAKTEDDSSSMEQLSVNTQSQSVSDV